MSVQHCKICCGVYLALMSVVSSGVLCVCVCVHACLTTATFAAYWWNVPDAKHGQRVGTYLSSSDNSPFKSAAAAVAVVVGVWRIVVESQKKFSILNYTAAIAVKALVMVCTAIATGIVLDIVR